MKLIKEHRCKQIVAIDFNIHKVLIIPPISRNDLNKKPLITCRSFISNICIYIGRNPSFALLQL